MIPDDPYRTAGPGELPEDCCDDLDDADEAYDRWEAEQE